MAEENKNIYLITLNSIFLLALVIFAVNCETLIFVNQAPEIPQDCYVIENNQLVINLNDVKALSVVGGSALVSDERIGDKILIANTGNESYRVVSSHCTHRDKALRYNHDAERFECSSMGRAKYDLDGNAKSGMADGDLQVYNFTIIQNKMTVSLF
ncbi:MAG: hypothetical protein SCALA702_21950 [Melioribacteraceae bacterium]|nr:MAG: hypothetical protein SCALA702_21950 [Melioribacteraceae bacterium]